MSAMTALADSWTSIITISATTSSAVNRRWWPLPGAESHATVM